MSTHRAWARRSFAAPLAAAAMALPALLPACAQLPQDVERPVSHALPADEGSPLAQWVQARRGADRARHPSGFALLSGSQPAYGARLALAEAARKTLDLQYYAIHADASSARLLASVREAAARGVRVRILLDDFHATGHNALVLRLALLPNIQMRMFNPLAGSRESTLARLVNSVGDAAQLQQRMHNKLFIADNALGITGGRNLGDAYFGNADNANFIDLDVLAAGPAVHDFSRSFDAYWNNPRAYPIQSLLTSEELRKVGAAQPAPAETGAARDGGAKPPDGEPRPGSANPSPQRQARAWEQQPLDLKSLPLVWAPAAVLVDKPAKIPANGDAPDAGAGAAPEGAPRPPGGVLATRPAATAPGALSAVVAQAPQDDNLIDGLLRLFGHARRDLLIVSPYFVPSPQVRAALAAARQRGVRVRLLTNSLASNDAPAAHAGYARYRKEMLALGVELYELRSEQAGLRSALGASGGGVSGASRSMLHSKMIAIDARLLVVGSMNLDLRSELQNTEVALIVRSEALTQEATRLVDEGLQRAAWRVQLDDGQLVWRAPQGSGLADSRTEPDASAGLRLLIRLFGPLAPEKLL